jgi:hypothetical protein
MRKTHVETESENALKGSIRDTLSVTQTFLPSKTPFLMILEVKTFVKQLAYK